MNWHSAIKLIFEVGENEVDVVHGGLDHVERGYTIELLTMLCDVHVEGDIMLSEIFDFEEGGEGLLIKRIEYKDLPEVVLFVTENLVKLGCLNFEEIDLVNTLNHIR